MTIQAKEITNKKETFLQTAHVQMQQWRNELDQLEEESKRLPADIQTAYRELIGNLREGWAEVEANFKDLKSAGTEEWEEAQTRWQKNSTAYGKSFMQTVNQINDEEKVPLGWLQGFTDKRTHESAGWAEGMGTRPEGSEGWAEGMGKQLSDSKGWAEGYDRAQER